VLSYCTNAHSHVSAPTHMNTCIHNDAESIGKCLDGSDGYVVGRSRINSERCTFYTVLTYHTDNQCQNQAVFQVRVRVLQRNGCSCATQLKLTHSLTRAVLCCAACLHQPCGVSAFTPELYTLWSHAHTASRAHTYMTCVCGISANTQPQLQIHRGMRE
jgi:hypothetical protein